MSKSYYLRPPKERRYTANASSGGENESNTNRSLSTFLMNAGVGVGDNSLMPNLSKVIAYTDSSDAEKTALSSFLATNNIRFIENDNGTYEAVIQVTDSPFIPPPTTTSSLARTSHSNHNSSSKPSTKSTKHLLQHSKQQRPMSSHQQSQRTSIGSTSSQMTASQKNLPQKMTNSANPAAAAGSIDSSQLEDPFANHQSVEVEQQTAKKLPQKQQPLIRSQLSNNYNNNNDSISSNNRSTVRSSLNEPSTRRTFSPEKTLHLPTSNAASKLQAVTNNNSKQYQQNPNQSSNQFKKTLQKSNSSVQLKRSNISQTHPSQSPVRHSAPQEPKRSPPKQTPNKVHHNSLQATQQSQQQQYNQQYQIPRKVHFSGDRSEQSPPNTNDSILTINKNNNNNNNNSPPRSDAGNPQNLSLNTSAIKSQLSNHKKQHNQQSVNSKKQPQLLSQQTKQPPTVKENHNYSPVQKSNQNSPKRVSPYHRNNNTIKNKLTPSDVLRLSNEQRTSLSFEKPALANPSHLNYPNNTYANNVQLQQQQYVQSPENSNSSTTAAPGNVSGGVNRKHNYSPLPNQQIARAQTQEPREGNKQIESQPQQIIPTYSNVMFEELDREVSGKNVWFQKQSQLLKHSLLHLQECQPNPNNQTNPNGVQQIFIPPPPLSAASDPNHYFDHSSQISTPMFSKASQQPKQQKQQQQAQKVSQTSKVDQTAQRSQRPPLSSIPSHNYSVVNQRSLSNNQAQQPQQHEQQSQSNQPSRNHYHQQQQPQHHQQYFSFNNSPPQLSSPQKLTETTQTTSNQLGSNRNHMNQIKNLSDDPSQIIQEEGGNSSRYGDSDVGIGNQSSSRLKHRNTNELNTLSSGALLNYYQQLVGKAKQHMHLRPSNTSTLTTTTTTTTITRN